MDPAATALTDEQINALPAQRLRYALDLAERGFHFAPARLGCTHGDTGWPGKATTDPEELKGWLADFETQLVMVAKFGKCAALDIDDWPACQALGFDPKWIEGMFRVKTPGGGYHIYSPWHAAFDAFKGTQGTKVDVCGADGGLIAELKLNHCTVTAPYSYRRPDEKHCEGFYIPDGGEVIPCPNPSAVAEWYRTHAKANAASAEFTGPKEKWDFHPDFDSDDFLEGNKCTLADGDTKGMHEGSHDLVVDSCPLCGKAARTGSTLTNFITKFKFGGTSYGFKCCACGVNTRAEFEKQMGEKYPDWKPWRWPIYEHDDNKFLFAEAKKAGWLEPIRANAARAGESISAPSARSQKAPKAHSIEELERLLSNDTPTVDVPAPQDEEFKEVPRYVPHTTAEVSLPSDPLKAALRDPRKKVRLPGSDYLLSYTAEELGECLANEPLFIRNDELVVLRNRKLERVTPQAFRTLVEHYAVCYRQQERGDNVITFDVTMSEGEACGILASLQFKRRIREISRLNLCRLPIWGKDGSLILLPDGYDPQSRTLTVGNVSYPDDMPLSEARATIDDLFGEFVFADGERSKAVSIAALVGMYAVQLIPFGSMRPCFIITKNAEGAGATTLVNCVGISVLGEVLTGVKPTDEDETRKLLTSIVRDGGVMVLFDNQKAKLSSASLEAFTSSPRWTDRTLGGNVRGTYDNLATVFVTSNGCTVSPDMRRRSLFIELHLEEERAEDRKFRRNLSYAVLLSLRPRILAACWSLVKNWHACGQPLPRRSNSTFDDWSNVIGGIVQAAGYGCCLETASVAEIADEDGDAMRTLVKAMEPGKRYTFGELTSLCRKNGCFENLVGGPGDLMTKSNQVTLGRLLGRYDHRVVGTNHFIIEGKKTHRKYCIAAQ